MPPNQRTPPKSKIISAPLRQGGWIQKNVRAIARRERPLIAATAPRPLPPSAPAHAPPVNCVDQHSNQPDRTDKFLSGCALGKPVPRGTPVAHCQDSDQIDIAMLRSIQVDDYESISQMIFAGWKPVFAPSCEFLVTISEIDEAKTWEISQATPLHYAICCGRFKAAAALLVAFPTFASMTCVVKNPSLDQEILATPLDLAVSCAQSFKSRSADCLRKYHEASLVLLCLNDQSSLLPGFMHLESPSSRLLAAGPCGEAVQKAFQDSIHSNCMFHHCPRDKTC
eukprot:CAMPEP_0181316712 /NCGR_PEP_ID=MMETSP1101-20121128/16044_1 /TAXON_ID=46948 /ORGANISM="Rhodomonas abbreviata, Strain Caron Lab Isolate" /LENGTH=281 /DNA_ID=CAMNT_0023423983 /DNA_START=192 /DNA_END=1037 /DNA_ORIENTATION=-